MGLSSSDVVAGNDILATDLNTLRSDVSDGDITTINRYFYIPLAVIKGSTSTADDMLEIVRGANDFYIKKVDAGFTQQTYFAALPHIPSGNTITQFRIGYKRDDNHADVDFNFTLKSFAFADTTEVDLANCDCDDVTGNLITKDDDTITGGAGGAVIDNSLYHYIIYIIWENNDADTDTKLYYIRITVSCAFNLP